MGYEDLPDDWAERRLDEAGLLDDVVDLVVAEADRRATRLVVLLADARLRLWQPLVIEDVPSCAADEQLEVCERLVELARGLCPGGGLALAVARPGSPTPTAWDLAWRRLLEVTCRTGGVAFLGCHLAVPGVVLRLDDDAAAARVAAAAS